MVDLDSRLQDDVLEYQCLGCDAWKPRSRFENTHDEFREAFGLCDDCAEEEPDDFTDADVGALVREKLAEVAQADEGMSLTQSEAAVLDAYVSHVEGDEDA